MFEPLEIIYASPLLMKVAFTVGLVAAVAFAATFLTMAIMDLRGGSRRMANMVVAVPIGRLAPESQSAKPTVASSLQPIDSTVKLPISGKSKAEALEGTSRPCPANTSLRKPQGRCS